MLAIPIKHVHPAGKCNRAMSQILRQHRAEDIEDGELLEGEDVYGEGGESATDIDPRWEQLRKLTENNN